MLGHTESEGVGGTGGAAEVGEVGSVAVTDGAMGTGI